MSLMICQHCGKPRLTEALRCPHCAAPSPASDQEIESDESAASLACLILMMIFVLILIMMPILLIAGMFIR
ncbi:MAG: hypothetical protein WKF30_06600 [Pyrinomonadaceae bacterium]